MSSRWLTRDTWDLTVSHIKNEKNSKEIMICLTEHQKFSKKVKNDWGMKGEGSEEEIGLTGIDSEPRGTRYCRKKVREKFPALPISTIDACNSSQRRDPCPSTESYLESTWLNCSREEIYTESHSCPETQEMQYNAILRASLHQTTS